MIPQPGEAPPLHVYHDTEQVFHVISGAGELRIATDRTDPQGLCFPVVVTDVVRIPPGAWHRVFCRGDAPLVYLSIDCFLKGRPTAEPTWESHVRGMCELPDPGLPPSGFSEIEDSSSRTTIY